MFLRKSESANTSLLGLLGSFDSSVHISEEASNAAVAVPWAIVYAIGIAGVLGWGQYTLCDRHCFSFTIHVFQRSTLHWRSAWAPISTVSWDRP